MNLLRVARDLPRRIMVAQPRAGPRCATHIVELADSCIVAAPFCAHRARPPRKPSPRAAPRWLPDGYTIGNNLMTKKGAPRLLRGVHWHHRHRRGLPRCGTSLREPRGRWARIDDPETGIDMTAALSVSASDSKGLRPADGKVGVSSCTFAGTVRQITTSSCKTYLGQQRRRHQHDSQRDRVRLRHRHQITEPTRQRRP